MKRNAFNNKRFLINDELLINKFMCLSALLEKVQGGKKHIKMFRVHKIYISFQVWNISKQPVEE